MPLRDRRRFRLLDGLRGVAAAAVVVGHASAVRSGDELNPNMGLAVPFFFILSGFVLCHAYAGMARDGRSLGRFAAHRLIRLLPMLVPASILGSMLLSWRLRSGQLPGTLSTSVAVAQVLSFTTLPAPFLSIDRWRWPVNPPEWSLFFELVGSAVLALVLLRSRAGVLMAVCAAAASLLVWLAVPRALIAPGLTGQLALTLFSFAAGRLAYDAYRRDPGPGRFRTIAVVALTALLFVPWRLPWPVQVAIIVAGMPAVILAATCDPEGSLARGTFHWLGELSYPVYILHFPVLGWIRQLAPGLGAAGMIASTLLLTVLGSWLLLVVYDRPLRRWLRRLG